VTLLVEIQDNVQARAGEIASAHGSWPCRNGCDDCCRHLASQPRVSPIEWRLIAEAIERLPSATAEVVRERIRESTGKARPVVCPLLDLNSGSCLVYGARPIACRAYGFYAERERVLGCGRIEALSRESPHIVWGNHTALEAWQSGLGTPRELSFWLDSGDSFRGV
jgi:Fe-S-cluster containining protein